MKLVSVKLNNIGLYDNEEIFFSSGSKKDVILFWGNNGAGKTTLINAIKIGFLGKDAFQMTYSEYCNYIKNNIITTRKVGDNFVASIQIKFENNENNSIVDYVLIRKWTIQLSEIEETVDIYRESIKLDYEEKEKALKMISRIMPPSLLDVIIFDGENAINILNNDKLNILIKSIIYSVFGMEVYVNLSKDLSAFLRSEKSNSSTSSDENASFIKTENEYKLKVSNYKKISELIQKETNNIASYKSEISFLSKKFLDKTGIKIDDMKDFDITVENAKAQKEKADSDIKYIYEEILPIKMVHKRLKRIIKNIDKEKPYVALKNIESLKQYFSDSKGALKLLNNLKKYIPEESGSFSYNLTDSEYNALLNTNSILDNYKKKLIIDSIDEKEEYFKDIKGKLLTLGKVEDDESKTIIKKLSDLYDNLKASLDTVNSLLIEQNNSEEEMNVVKNEYELKKSVIKKQKKESNSYVSALKYRDAIDEFVDENIHNICSELNDYIIVDLKKMKFRNNSIGRIDISPENFNISLFEKNGDLIPSSLFSAGEKQVLLGLVIKNALALSNNDTFFLFDTPVGRLDMDNRNIFTNEVILNVSNQVAIFATNSDYSKKDYNNLKKKLTNEMKLVRTHKDLIKAEKGSIYK